MSKTIQLLFILLFIHCFTSKRILARIISITDTSTPNEKVIQSAIYQDDTILLRLVNVTNGCYENQVKLKLIQDETIKTLIINSTAIVGQNFCIPPTNRELEGDIPLDGIRIYSLNPQYILLTYFCTIEQNTMCGQLINWDNENLSKVDFGQSCDNSSIVMPNLIDGRREFLRACYLSQQSQVIWTRYTIDKTNYSINAQDSGSILNVGQFSQLSKHLFPTAGGGYGIVINQTVGPLGTSPALYVNFVPPLSYINMNGPYQLYTSTSQILAPYNVYKCGISFVGLGYNCIISLVNTFVNINFLDSGSILNTNEFLLPNLNAVRIELLNYGGFVLINNSTSGVLSGIVYNNDGTLYTDNGARLDGNWGMPLTFNYTGIFGVFPNNTIWSIGNDAQGVQQLITNDLFVNYSSDVSQESMERISNFGNPFIDWVTIGNNNYTNFNGIIQIPTTINPPNIFIKYVNLIELSNGNISIWQSWGDQMTLRQSFSSKQSQFIQLGNDMIVTITLFESTFNLPGARYYIKIDPGFVKDLRTGQGLIGIRKNRWSFIRETNVQDTGTGSASALVRLTPAGTGYFTSLKGQEAFINSMTQELTRLIPIDSSRLSTSKYFQYDPSVPEDQILFRIDVKVANEGDLVGMANGPRVVKDLDTLIRNKKFTGIGRSEFSSMLDDTFGSEIAPKLWDRYRWILIGVGAAILLLIILFSLARQSGVNKGRGRNYVIFIFAIILIDFGLDVAFVVLHGHDLKWLYPTSVVFLTFPILINTIVTVMIIAKETASKDDQFVDWWRRNSKIALFFTLFSIIDIEGLTIMSSGYAGYDRFNAPISDASFKGIIFASAVVKILEDVPQLVIYSLYQVRTIVPAIIPILVLSSCCFVIAIKTAIVIGFCIYRPPPRSYYSKRQMKKDKLKEESKEYKRKSPSPPPGTPKLPFADGSKSTTPDSALAQATDTGTPTFQLRDEKESDILNNLSLKTVGIPVSQSIVNVSEGFGGRTGEERLSDQGIIESTEENGNQPSEAIEPLETGSIEVLDPGDPGDTGDTGGSVIQGPSSGYQSRLIEKIEMDPEEQPQQEQEQQEPSPSQSTSSLGTFVRSIGRRKDSQKGKARGYDDKSKKG